MNGKKKRQITHSNLKPLFTDLNNALILDDNPRITDALVQILKAPGSALAKHGAPTFTIAQRQLTKQIHKTKRPTPSQPTTTINSSSSSSNSSNSSSSSSSSSSSTSSSSNSNSNSNSFFITIVPFISFISFIYPSSPPSSPSSSSSQQQLFNSAVNNLTPDLCGRATKLWRALFF